MAAYEIVRVLDQKNLIDGESYQRTYVTRGGRVLPSGFYVVMWPAGTLMPTFDAEAEYFGPFKLALHAKLKLTQYLEEYHSRQPEPRATYGSHVAQASPF